MTIGEQIYDANKIAGMIDQTLLAADATQEQIVALCEVSRQYRFCSVCTNAFWSERVARELDGAGIETCFVVGFPLGATTTAAKVHETADTLRVLGDAPAAVDMVANIGLLKDKRYKEYTADIAAVVAAGESATGGVKAILETGLLSDEEIEAGCKCAVEAGVAFVKTSTGRGGTPLVRHVRIMRGAVPAETGVKFSGFGNFNPAELAIMGIRAGANRLGSPVGTRIVKDIATCYDGTIFQ